MPVSSAAEHGSPTEDHESSLEHEAHSRLRLPKSGVGAGALVLGGDSGAGLAERLLDLGFVVEVSNLGGEPESLEAALDGLSNAIDGLVHSGAVTGEQVALVAAGEHAPLAIWASTLDTRIGAVVTFGMTPWPQDLQPRYRMSDASYMGHHGGLDPLIDEVKPSSLEMTMRDVGLDATFHLYRRAKTRFFDAGSEDFDQGLADLAWRRTRLFLKRAL